MVGERALIFAHHRQHVARRRHRDARKRLAQELGDAPLMGGVGEGVQEADRDRIDLEAAQRLGGGGDASLVERLEHRAAGARRVR